MNTGLRRSAPDWELQADPSWTRQAEPGRARPEVSQHQHQTLIPPSAALSSERQTQTELFIWRRPVRAELRDVTGFMVGTKTTRVLSQNNFIIAALHQSVTVMRLKAQAQGRTPAPDTLLLALALALALALVLASFHSFHTVVLMVKDNYLSLHLSTLVTAALCLRLRRLNFAVFSN